METESHEFHKKIQKDLHDFNIFAGLAASTKDQCVLMMVSFSFAQNNPLESKGCTTPWNSEVFSMVFQ